MKANNSAMRRITKREDGTLQDEAFTEFSFVPMLTGRIVDLKIWRFGDLKIWECACNWVKNNILHKSYITHHITHITHHMKHTSQIT